MGGLLEERTHHGVKHAIDRGRAREEAGVEPVRSRRGELGVRRQRGHRRRVEHGARCAAVERDHELVNEASFRPFGAQLIGARAQLDELDLRLTPRQLAERVDR